MKHRLPLDLPFSYSKEWKSVMVNNVILFAIFGSLSLLLGFKTLMLIHVPMVLIAGTAGVWLFYVQHQFEDTRSLSTGSARRLDRESDAVARSGRIERKPRASRIDSDFAVAW